MLLPRDYDSQVWRRLERSLEERIERLQIQLERPGIAEREADVVRGQILECRYLLSRPVRAGTVNESPEITAEDEE